MRILGAAGASWAAMSEEWLAAARGAAARTTEAEAESAEAARRRRVASGSGAPHSAGAAEARMEERDCKEVSPKPRACVRLSARLRLTREQGSATLLDSMAAAKTI